MAMPKYVYNCINSYDQKKQHPYRIPDSIQPRITLSQTE